MHNGAWAGTPGKATRRSAPSARFDGPAASAGNRLAGGSKRQGEETSVSPSAARTAAGTRRQLVASQSPTTVEPAAIRRIEKRTAIVFVPAKADDAQEHSGLCPEGKPDLQNPPGFPTPANVPPMCHEERRTLLDWFERVRRPLPWRASRDPYAIWVSEVMLQQTRVDTVIPYWERFLARFPSVHALAEASEEEVLAAWSGLGYYRRARALHAAARLLVSEHGGHLPEEPARLRELPGFGPYTSGAVASIAFGRCEPAVDGNVARVLSRLRGIRAPLGRAKSRRALDAAARALLSGCERPGDLNQALMELGATLCTPRTPRCPDCPLRGTCSARASGDPEALPVAAPRRAPREERWAALLPVVTEGDRLAVWMERAEGTRFGGLWSPPMRPIAEGESAEMLWYRLGSCWVSGSYDVERLGELHHVLTHRRLHVSVARLRLPSGHVPQSGTLQLQPASQWHTIGLSTLARRLLALAEETAKPPEVR